MMKWRISFGGRERIRKKIVLYFKDKSSFSFHRFYYSSDIQKKNNIQFFHHELKKKFIILQINLIKTKS